MRYAQPMIFKPEYFVGIESEIDRLFWEAIYAPLSAVLRSDHPEYHNARSPLFDAVYEGAVWYEDGAFRGQFSAHISAQLRALGAMFDARSKAWRLPLGDVPPDVSTAQARADSRYDALRRGLLTTLADIDVESVVRHSQTKAAYQKTIEWMDGDFQRAVERITIAPKLSTAQRSMIARDWGNNLNLYIKGWTSDNIIGLRDKLQKPILGGQRAAALAGMIQENYGVSRNKAKFLARQETSLLMSSFKESRGAALGLNKYRWSTSHDERVRHDHALLNGNIYSFTLPPITNRKTGARNNPGCDWNCRCNAILCAD
jgi:SPP1 gp7 family putative phage head morphogenesis protein